MADPAPTTNPAPSYSIEVPTQDPTLTPPNSSAYFRLGAPDPTSAREVAYFGATLSTTKPGTLLLSSGDFKFVAPSTTTLKTSAEALALTADGTKVISAVYSFGETGTYRDVTYKINHATTVSVGDSQTWKTAVNTDFGISIDQKVAVGASLTTKVSSDITVPIGVLTMLCDRTALDVKSEFGNFKTATIAKTEGTEGVSIAVTPLANDILAMLKSANATVTVLTGIVAGIGGTAMIVPTGVVGTTALDKSGSTVTSSYEASTKDWLKGLSIIGLTSMSLLSVAQATYIALGTYAAVKGKVPAVGIFPTIKIDRDSIVMSAGLSKLSLTSYGIQLENAESQIKLGPYSSSIKSGVIELSAMSASSVKLGFAAAEISGPRVILWGLTALEGSAPMVSFGP